MSPQLSGPQGWQLLGSPAPAGSSPSDPSLAPPPPSLSLERRQGFQSVHRERPARGVRGWDVFLQNTSERPLASTLSPGTTRPSGSTCRVCAHLKGPDVRITVAFTVTRAQPPGGPACAGQTGRRSPAWCEGASHYSAELAVVPRVGAQCGPFSQSFSRSWKSDFACELPQC